MELFACSSLQFSILIKERQRQRAHYDIGILNCSLAEFHFIKMEINFPEKSEIDLNEMFDILFTYAMEELQHTSILSSIWQRIDSEIATIDKQRTNKLNAYIIFKSIMLLSINPQSTI